MKARPLSPRPAGIAVAATPREIVMKLNAGLGRALASADIHKRFDDMGLVAQGSTPEEFGGFLRSEMKRWSAVLAAKP